MESTFEAGDIVIVNKLAYGGRIPITWLSIPFSGVYSDLIQFSYCRFPGFKKYKLGDIVLLNKPAEKDPPIDKKSRILGRIIALPGDTLLLEKKRIFVDDIEYLLPESCQYLYRVTTYESGLTKELQDKYGINEFIKIGKLPVYDIQLTREISGKLLNDSLIRYVRELYEIPSKMAYDLFPSNQYYIWNKDYYGPIMIPEKGQTIVLDEFNIPLYKEIIETFEKNQLRLDDGRVYINGREVNYYTFDMDYFFVLNDNFDFPDDSRKWGFVPESHIIGVVF